MNQFPTKLVTVAVVLLVTLVTLVMAFDIVPIHGSEVGVKESWLGGVNSEPLTPRTYFVLPWERITPYSTAVNVFVMNDKTPSQGEEGTGRDQDSYLVQSKDSQDMHLSIQTQWRIDPEHVVNMHKTVGPKGIEERLLRPTMLRVVKDEATLCDAIDAYSGQGLVELQQAIERDLNNPEGELRQKGIIVDSFVIEHIRLDPDYVKEITARQIAMQREIRAKQEEKAAMAESLKAKAEARSAYEKAVVDAERDKAVQVLAAEANNEQEILKAEAEAKKVVLAANAEKESGELKAAAMLAIGKAKAESEQLLFTAYSANGADTYARIQIAESMSKAFGNIKGYLPETMQVYTLGSSFTDAVDNVLKGGKTAQTGGAAK